MSIPELIKEIEALHSKEHPDQPLEELTPYEERFDQVPGQS